MSRLSFAAPARRLIVLTALVVQLSLAPGLVSSAHAFSPTAVGIAPIATSPAATLNVAADLQAELWAALRRARTPSVAPGLSMSVLTGDGRQWSGSDGWHANGEWLNVDDPLVIGSVTKTFTAAVTILLAQEGLIDLDAPTQTYLRNVRLVKGTTVRQLLSHTSGIADLYAPAIDVLQNDPQRQLTSNGVLRPIGEKWFKPGTGYAYSNTNYYLLGLIIERVTGQSVQEAIQARLTGPLGLERTRLLSPADSKLPPAWTTCFWTSGAMVSTPTELARWGQALYGGGVLTEARLASMIDFSDGHYYGEGAQLLPLGDRWVPGHSGLLYDTTTLLVHLPKENVTIAIAGTAPLTDLEAALVASYDGGPSLLDLALQLAA